MGHCQRGARERPRSLGLQHPEREYYSLCDEGKLPEVGHDLELLLSAAPAKRRAKCILAVAPCLNWIPLHRTRAFAFEYFCGLTRNRFFKAQSLNGRSSVGFDPPTHHPPRYGIGIDPAPRANLSLF